ncbi:hypothetical protein DEIPH_ctg004orf0070 [Deinococcus phoenicis]|uniref:Uncharacterized protein n=1 Tax=Deinococcus phoenicis TaxID=1476583 RepID=A0A016QTZ4_9DEIO|nr:hypothetical protein [Deinococcus phoenicis]EYB69560.1 hypothetical protein DEIPH_ctg004orf0070 [Deinococcus phoenicis]
MSDPKREEHLEQPDLDQHDVIEEGMQGGTGDMDANGLEKNFDREEKLGELRDNLADVTAPGEGRQDSP